MLLFFAALALTPVGVEAAYGDGVFTLTGRAGPVPVKLFPRERATGRELEKDARRDERSLLRRLPPPVLVLLVKSACPPTERLLRRMRVSSLRLRYTAAGPDPCAAVMAYVRAGLVMERIAGSVGNADLRADVDLAGTRSVLDGEIAVRVRLGTVFYGLVCFGIGFLRGYYRYQRERR